MLSILVTIVLPAFIVMAFGFLLARGRTFDLRPISRVTLYILSPCLVFSRLARSSLTAGDFGLIVAFAVSTTLLMGFISWGVARGLRLERRTESAFLLSALFMNAGNYGLPLDLFAFGEEGLARAIVFFATSSFLVNTLGVYMASRGNSSVKDSMAHVFKMPLVYAALGGLGVNLAGLIIPEPIFGPLKMAGDAAIPLMLIILGVELSRVSIKHEVRLIGIATITRLMLAPILAILMAMVMGLRGVTRQVCILEASMPTAVMSTLLAVEFESKPEFVTGVVFSSTLASILTLTLLLRYLMG